MSHAVQAGPVADDDFPDPRWLVHLCGRLEWGRARTTGVIRPESSNAAGFVHLSTQGQVHLPANRIFGDRSDLMLLYIDPAALDAPLRWEPGVPGDPDGMLFPHLYGALPTDAVVAVQPYCPGPDGRYPPVIPRPGGCGGNPKSPAPKDC